MNMRQQHQQQRIEFQRNIIDSQHWATCLNCDYWDEKQGVCAKYRERPPLAVVVVGCQEWEGMIPF